MGGHGRRESGLHTLSSFCSCCLGPWEPARPFSGSDSPAAWAIRPRCRPRRWRAAGEGRLAGGAWVAGRTCGRRAGGGAGRGAAAGAGRGGGREGGGRAAGAGLAGRNVRQAAGGAGAGPDVRWRAAGRRRRLRQGGRWAGGGAGGGGWAEAALPRDGPVVAGPNRAGHRSALDGRGPAHSLCAFAAPSGLSAQTVRPDLGWDLFSSGVAPT